MELETFFLLGLTNVRTSTSTHSDSSDPEASRLGGPRTGFASASAEACFARLDGQQGTSLEDGDDILLRYPNTRLKRSRTSVSFGVNERVTTSLFGFAFHPDRRSPRRK